MSFVNSLMVSVLVMVGHLAIWCAVFNQIHATNWARLVRKISERAVYVIVAFVAVWLVNFMITPPNHWITYTVWSAYEWICIVVAVLVTVHWLIRQNRQRECRALKSVRSQLIDLSKQMERPHVHGLTAKAWQYFPGNQILMLAVEHRIIEVPGWPHELDGLVIAHLSDLHFTGRISREYYEHVVRLSNECSPDLVCLTGDVIDVEACLSWLQPTLGKIRARFGKYYVLGNHDKLIRDENRMRSAVEAAGFVHAKPNWNSVPIRGSQIYVSGNELPWYEGAEKTKPNASSSPKLLLAHSPDQVFAANELGVNLMLAGHTHGGQIRFPLIGPIVAPSRYGVRFASGTFEIGTTIMHVSRGISGDNLIRWNCPPELAILKINRQSTLPPG